MGIRRSVEAWVLLAGLGLPVSAVGATLDSMIRDYERAYRARSGSMETIYGLARAIGDSLAMQSEGASHDLESMTDAQFASLQARLPGMELVRDELVGGLVDVPAFQARARTVGNSADVAFFDCWFAIEDSSSWPNFVERQTDYSGCILFGSGRLVAAYANWTGFLARYPGRYQAWADEEAGVVVTYLVSGTCACGDRASVLRELDLFLERFPHGDAAEMARARRIELLRGTGELKEHC